LNHNQKTLMQLVYLDLYLTNGEFDS